MVAQALWHVDDAGPVPERLRDLEPRINTITGHIVSGSIAVQRELGTGLLERSYEVALAHELRLRGLQVDTQVPLTVEYRGLRIPRAHLIDLVVEREVAVELKAAEALVPEHFAQMLTYLRFGGLRVGLLVNFHAYPLKTGIHRLLNPRPSPPLSSASPRVPLSENQEEIS